MEKRSKPAQHNLKIVKDQKMERSPQIKNHNQNHYHKHSVDNDSHNDTHSTTEDSVFNDPPHDNRHHHSHFHKHSRHSLSTSSTSITSSSSSSSSSSTSSSSSFSSSASSSLSTTSSSSSSSDSDSESSNPQVKPQHSRSCTDISRKNTYFDECDDTAPLLGKGEHVDRNQQDSAQSRPRQGKHEIIRDGSVRKAKSMESLARPKQKEPQDGAEQDIRQQEARKNIVKEKIKFSAFLNEITRQVLSPMRLTTLGVTNTQRPHSVGQASARCTKPDKMKPERQTHLQGSADSASSGKPSEISSKRSHSHQRHYSHRSAGSPERETKGSFKRHHSWSYRHRSCSPSDKHHHCHCYHPQYGSPSHEKDYHYHHYNRHHHSPMYNHNDKQKTSRRHTNHHHCPYEDDHHSTSLHYYKDSGHNHKSCRRDYRDTYPSHNSDLKEHSKSPSQHRHHDASKGKVAKYDHKAHHSPDYYHNEQELQHEEHRGDRHHSETHCHGYNHHNHREHRHQSEHYHGSNVRKHHHNKQHGPEATQHLYHHRTSVHHHGHKDRHEPRQHHHHDSHYHQGDNHKEPHHDHAGHHSERHHHGDHQSEPHHRNVDTHNEPHYHGDHSELPHHGEHKRKPHHHHGDTHSEPHHHHGYRHNESHHHGEQKNDPHCHGDHQKEPQHHHRDTHSESHHHHGDHHREPHHHHHGDHPSEPHHHHGDHHNEPHHHHGDQHNESHSHHGDHHNEPHHHHGDQHNEPHHHHGDHHNEPHHPHGDHHNEHHHHHGDQHNELHHHGDQHTESHHHHEDQHNELHHHHLDQHSEPHHHRDYQSEPHHHHGDHSKELHHLHEDHHPHYEHNAHQKHLEGQCNSHFHLECSQVHSKPNQCHSGSYPNLKPAEKMLESSRNSLRAASASSQDEEQTSFSNLLHDESTDGMGQIIILQEQNEGLQQSLLKTAVRVECLGEEFMSSRHCLEAELQKTRLELSNLTERFKRLHDNCSSTQQTNSLLEHKLHLVAQNMEGERERLNKRISALTERLADAKFVNNVDNSNAPHYNIQSGVDLAVSPVALPPAQFMDSLNYAKEKVAGQEQSLGSVPEEEESDWSEIGEETPRFVLTGLNRGQAWRLRESDEDKTSESGREEIFQPSSSCHSTLPHLQFTVHNEILPLTHTNLSNIVTCQSSYKITTNSNLGSSVLVRSASLEEIPFARHTMPKELRGTEAMMDLHHSEAEAVHDLDNEFIHHLKSNRDTVHMRQMDSSVSEMDTAMSNLQSAERILNHLISETQHSEAEVHSWSEAVPDKLFKGERTKL